MNIDDLEREIADYNLGYQPHRKNDPEIWGLAEVETRHTPAHPVTVYNIAGDNASGVAGLLLVDPRRWLPVLPSRVGVTELVRDDDTGEDYYCTTVWDCSTRAPEFQVTLPDGSVEIRREHSIGILLASYESRRPERVTERGASRSLPAEMHGLVDGNFYSTSIPHDPRAHQMVDAA